LRYQTNCPNTTIRSAGLANGSPFDVAFGATDASGTIDQSIDAVSSTWAYTDVQVYRDGSSVKSNAINFTLNPP
jgi:hypothetical protein